MDGIIINLFNDGVLEMAENQLISFKKVGITKYISYTTGEKSYQYLKNKGYNVKLYNIDNSIQNEMNWCSKDFIDMEKIRIKLINELLCEYKCVFYLDVDIVVTNNIEIFFNANMNGNDIFIQNDINMPCVGCILLFNSKNVKKILDTLLKIEYKTNLQFEFSKLLKQLKLNYNLLPIDLFPNGLIFFGNDYIPTTKSNKFLLHQTQYIRKKTLENLKENNIFLIHANYMTGSDNKIKAFKDFNLWYLN